MMTTSKSDSSSNHPEFLSTNIAYHMTTTHYMTTAFIIITIFEHENPFLVNDITSVYIAIIVDNDIKVEEVIKIQNNIFFFHNIEDQQQLCTSTWTTTD